MDIDRTKRFLCCLKVDLLYRFYIIDLLLFIKLFPDNVVLVYDDWGTTMKVRTSVNLTPEQWRSAKDTVVHNFLLHYIDGKSPNGGVYV